jgi:hypothetical protein
MAQELYLLITSSRSFELKGSILRKSSAGLTCNDGFEAAVQNLKLTFF